MKRALLVTTGTVVGVVSAIAYGPEASAIALTTGTESATTTAGMSNQPAAASAVGRLSPGLTSATVTLRGGKVSDLSFVRSTPGRNPQFSDAETTQLVPEILRTQNVTVGIVSGPAGASMGVTSSLRSILG